MDLFLVDAFAKSLFQGNPAGVCPLKEWLPDKIMLKIAAENNQAETAFFVHQESHIFQLRWFTPTSEIEMCGHATLASAHIIFSELYPDLDQISFMTKSGELIVKRAATSPRYCMIFPCEPGVEDNTQLQAVVEALGATPVALFAAPRNLMAVFASSSQVLAIQPNQDKIRQLETKVGLIVTAPSDLEGEHEEEIHCVSRYFAPKFGVAEDAVTGSAHVTIVPYYVQQLRRDDIRCVQISVSASNRRGDLWCRLTQGGKCVEMEGNCHTYLKGKIHI